MLSMYINVICVFLSYLMWVTMLIYDAVLPIYNLQKPPRWRIGFEKFGCSNSSRDRLKSYKKALRAQLQNTWQKGECRRYSVMTIRCVSPCHSWCHMIKNPHCSMDMSAEYWSKYDALYR